MTKLPILLVLLATPFTQSWSGILLYGQAGAQTYSPFVHPHGAVAPNLGMPQPPDALGWNNLLNFNGSAYALGGLDVAPSPPVPRNTVTVMDPRTNMTTSGPSLPYPTYGIATATLLYNSSIVMCGGVRTFLGIATSECYQMASGKWTQIADYPQPIVYASMVILDYRPYVFGGADSDNANVSMIQQTASVYVYDLSANWVKRADMPMAKENFGMILYDDASSS